MRMKAIYSLDFYKIRGQANTPGMVGRVGLSIDDSIKRGVEFDFRSAL